MSQAIIITGMHRSGTSLVSSLLQHAGVHIGEKLIAANSANPRGYFEDVDFYEYHEHLLHERGQTYLHVDGDFKLEPTDAETERARQLIAERSHRHVWGWKDPRTSLFLSFWHKLVPEARFLFVYRHPIEVLLSLLRRGEFDSHPSLMAGLNAWHTYNANIQTFFNEHADRCLLVHIDGVVKHSDRFVQLLRDKLQMDSCLNSEALAQIYHSNELQKTSYSPELSATLETIHPQLLELYEQLNQKADLRNDEIQSDSQVPECLSQVAQFAERTGRPISEPVKHSLVQMLLSSLAPDLTSRMLDRFNRSTRETQRKIDYLWLEVQRLQRLESDKNQELERVHRFTADQQQELESIQLLNADQQRELESIQLLNADQQRDLERIKLLNAKYARDLEQLERLHADHRQELDRLHQLYAEQHDQLLRAQQLNVEYSQQFDRLVRLNTEHSHELYCQAVRVETLVEELSFVRNTRVWKAMQSYQRFKSRWTKAA